MGGVQPTRLVLFRYRELNVDRGEEGEDVSLEYGHEDFKECEDKPEGKAAGAEKRPPTAKVDDEELGGCKEQHQQQVADHHVHQQSQRQRHGANDERRNEFDRRDDDVDGPRHATGEQGVLEEVLRTLLDSRVDEGHVTDDGQRERHGDDARTRDVQERDDSRDVHEQDHEEHRRKDRQEALCVFLAEEVFTDVDSDEVQAHLDEALETSRNDLHAARTEPEDQYNGESRQELDEVNSRDRNNTECFEENFREELVDRGSVKFGPSVGSGVGDQGRSMSKQR